MQRRPCPGYARLAQSLSATLQCASVYSCFFSRPCSHLTTCSTQTASATASQWPANVLSLWAVGCGCVGVPGFVHMYTCVHRIILGVQITHSHYLAVPWHGKQVSLNEACTRAAGRCSVYHIKLYYSCTCTAAVRTGNGTSCWQNTWQLLAESYTAQRSVVEACRAGSEVGMGRVGVG